MKKQAIIVILLTITMINAIAQVTSNPIEYRFVGGEDAFYMLIYNNIKYPDASKKIGSYGCSISKFSLTPTGEISEIKIINPIDKYIDNVVINLILSTKDRWIKYDSIVKNHVFYMQIDFLFSGLRPSSFAPRSNAYSSLFLNPIVVTVLAPNNAKNKIIDDQILAISGATSIEEGRYTEALEVFNELIKRHPFNKELYKLRMLINTKLGQTDLVNLDINTINNFAEGYSLDEIMGVN